ncbi:NRT2 ribosyltransferase, partial [Erithacus rubecula]|nr:NRT2 ribosyltransferase [Erithacus rubecula]
WPLPSMALLALTLALLARTVATTLYVVKPLDMASDSFDDQYQDCGPAMKEALPALNSSEFQKNPLFAQVWQKAVAQWQKLGSPVSPLSSSDQAIAIIAYTTSDLQQEFNKDVSTAGSSPQEYRDNFHFKTLHFLLTDALATLRDTRKEQECLCVHWGVDQYKFKANEGDTVRFGQFTLSKPCEGGYELSTTTLFSGPTCYGVDIRAFTGNLNSENVLIPPFEKFNVTKVIKHGEKVQILLNSIGTNSKYNCEWLKGGDSLGLWGHP